MCLDLEKNSSSERGYVAHCHTLEQHKDATEKLLSTFRAVLKRSSFTESGDLR